MRLPVIAAGLLTIAALTMIWAGSVLSSSPDTPPLIYTVTPRYVPLAWLRGGERFPVGAKLVITRSLDRHDLVPDFAASADANVSFDGTRVLFAGKRRRGDHWQIWELAGHALKQLTSCLDDCLRPFYLPEDRFVYAHKQQGRFAIEAAALRGAPVLSLTYGPGNYFPTDILHDGRILFEAGYPFGSETAPEIYTVYSDGSGVESFRCDHGSARHSGRQVASSDIVFAQSRGLGRFTSALAREIEMPTPAGEYTGDIVEVSSAEWILSMKSDVTVSQKTRSGAAPGVSSHFRLVRWTPGTKNLRSLVSDGESDLVQPVLLTARPVPNRHPSALHDWNYANLLALNAYTSKYRFADGSIVTVQLYTQDSGGVARLLGSAPVEKDGSFYLRTPAEQPLKIELLDATGKTLKREAGWFWLRKGEQRICVGCHAGPETAPENAVPMVLQRSTVAADMTGAAMATVHGGH